MTMPTQETSPTRSRRLSIRRRRCMSARGAAGARAPGTSRNGTDGSTLATSDAPAAPVGDSYWLKRGHGMTDEDAIVFIAACAIGTIVCVLFALGVIQ